MSKEKLKTKVANFLEYAAIVLALVATGAIFLYFLMWGVWGILIGGTHLYNFIIGG